MTTPVAAAPRTPSSWVRNAALVVPLVLVNATAIYGQGGWAYDNLVPLAVRQSTILGAVALCLMFAVTVESVGVYLAYEAHLALMEDQAAGLLRSGSYGVALVVGSLNYAHFAGPGYRPNPLAVTFGLLSSLSPWLWAIRSRSLHRADLLAKGLIDPRSVRFTLAQRVMYPVQSFRAYRLAVWNGVNNPAQARTDLIEHRRTTTKVPVLPTTVVPPTATTDAAAEPTTPPPTKRPAKPLKSRQRAPRTPERPTVVPAVDRDAAVLTRLAETYPDRTPSLSEVSAVAGGGPPRAIRLRNLLIKTRDAEEHVS